MPACCAPLPTLTTTLLPGRSTYQPYTPWGTLPPRACTASSRALDASSVARLWRALRISTPVAACCGRIEVVATTSWKLPLPLRSIQLPAKLRPCALASCFSCSAARRSILRYWDSWAEVRPRSRSIAARREGDNVSDGPAAEAAMATASDRGESTIRPRLAQEANLRICKSPVVDLGFCRTRHPCGGDAAREEARPTDACTGVF